MIRVLLLALCLSPASLWAWEFSSPIDVSVLQQGVHHLQTASARSLAVSKQAVALVWEDNHSGKPAIYFAVKAFKQPGFSAARRLSGEQSAFDPTVVSDGQRFVVMWESANHIHGSVCDLQGCSRATQLSISPTRQVSLAQDAKGKLYFAWASRLKKVYQLQVGEVAINRNTLEIHNPINVTAAPKQAQSFPSLSVLTQGWTVAFEDREQGHTRLMTAFKPAGKSFLSPQLLNDFIKTPNARYGAGTGAMRAQLTDDGQSNAAVIWLDKRHFEGGYDVYAARSQDAGKTFARDEKVQDMLGENQPQWHANIAMSRQGKLVSAWTDPRDGTMDIWYSWRSAQGWSDDESLPTINETGQQSNPALAFDANEILHIAFVDVKTVDGKKVSRIRYLTATH